RRKERQQSAQPQPSPLEAYESLYFDRRGYMRALTGRGERPEAWRWIDQAQQRLEQEEAEREQRAERDAVERARQQRRQALERRHEAVGREIDGLRFWSWRHGKLTKELNELEQQLAALDSEQGSQPKALTDGAAAAPAEQSQPEGDDLRLDLLFLVDDLDRCLPEKAVEVLEAIKLFLEVPGCAFVIGVDD
ncbi:MAG: hypothetical protein KDK70_44340, partial [Myxococcales bacterium]|nr:hypothetical protein [Myxococcales bacterium]